MISTNNMVVSRLVVYMLVAVGVQPIYAVGFKDDVAPLIKSSCIQCHNEFTRSRLNFRELDHDLSDPATFRKWLRILDRASNDEMPPKTEKRPDAALLKTALASLKKELLHANTEAQQKNGRTVLRRLTRLEYEYTLHDLLGIQTELAKLLPAENDSSSFDTVATGHGISALHVRSYLKAADRALDATIRLGKRPRTVSHNVDYMNSRYVNMWYDRSVRAGGGVIKKMDDGVALFIDGDYIMRSDRSGFSTKHTGLYRITAEVYAYQARTPVTLTLIKASDMQGVSTLLGAFDLKPGASRKVEVTAYLNQEEYIYPSVADMDWQTNGQSIWGVKGPDQYTGEGIVVKSLKVEGPLEKIWPPLSTRQLLTGVEFEPQRGSGQSDGSVEVKLNKDRLQHVADVVQRLAPLAYRRPLKDGEAKALVDLAKQPFEQGRDFRDVVRIPLRAMLSSPQFLFHANEPGRLNDYALASRLSYFLWKSMPDEELFRLAREKKLSDPQVLAEQVDRMLEDDKSQRFVRDFVGQWLGLRGIDATTPDQQLFPEYDDLLRQAMLSETEQFVAELFKQNLSLKNLIDSDFTFLNRRLAEHYEIPGVEGQHVRKVRIPSGSPRGGILTHASVLKVTANGSLTSPVRRGNFVLANVLGQPAPTPPSGIDGIDPDTRGTTTIRETLAAHSDDESCAKCHVTIDPPGFAMESFDPIGGFRTRYRSVEKGDRPQRKLFGRNVWEYKVGLQVDATGTTADGVPFEGFREFKRLLLRQKEQVARNFISQLVVYATGCEIELVDRQHVERIVEKTRGDEFPARAIVHQIVQSELFRNK